jgi:phage-related protein
MKIVLPDKVSKFLESKLDEKEIAKTIRVIDLLEEFGNKLGMPHSKHIDDGIFELRIRGRREIRILYCFEGNSSIMLNAFIKKTEKTPSQEMNKAKKAKTNLQ